VRVLLKFAGEEVPASGASLLADGKDVGHVTRAAFSPVLQAPIAMGYVRRESSTAGSELLCGSVSVTVIAAPLPESKA
jgi:glycine cleavage system aminomethyltransferase T